MNNGIHVGNDKASMEALTEAIIKIIGMEGVGELMKVEALRALEKAAAVSRITLNDCTVENGMPAEDGPAHEEPMT